MRFPSAQVVRFCDARAMQLTKALPADGRWRIVVFAGDIQLPGNAERLERVFTYSHILFYSDLKHFANLLFLAWALS